MREIVNALFYVLRGGIAWRLLPSDFPPWGTVYRWFAAWRDGCLLERINHALVIADRERVGHSLRHMRNAPVSLNYRPILGAVSVV